MKKSKSGGSKKSNLNEIQKMQFGQKKGKKMTTIYLDPHVYLFLYKKIKIFEKPPDKNKIIKKIQWKWIGGVVKLAKNSSNSVCMIYIKCHKGYRKNIAKIRNKKPSFL